MLPGHPIWVSAVAFGPNNFLASTSYGGKVRLWDAESGQGLGTLQGYSQVICAVSFSPDGKLLAHGDDQGMIHVWDVSSGRHLNSFRGLAGRVWSVAFSPDGKTIACGGDDQTIRLWKVGKRTGRGARAVSEHLSWSYHDGLVGGFQSRWEKTCELWL